MRHALVGRILASIGFHGGELCQFSAFPRTFHERTGVKLTATALQKRVLRNAADPAKVLVRLVATLVNLSICREGHQERALNCNS